MRILQAEAVSSLANKWATQLASPPATQKTTGRLIETANCLLVAKSVMSPLISTTPSLTWISDTKRAAWIGAHSTTLPALATHSHRADASRFLRTSTPTTALMQHTTGDLESALLINTMMPAARSIGLGPHRLKTRDARIMEVWVGIWRLTFW